MKRVRSCASSTNQGTMKLMIRAYKQGIDLAQVPLGTDRNAVEDWATLPRAPLSYEPEPKTKAEVQAEARAAAKKHRRQGRAREKAEVSADFSPAMGGTFPNLESCSTR